MDFQNLVGNEKIKQELQKAIRENKIVNSYLWVGTKGIGKSAFAKAFAKRLLCQTGEENCTCNSCVKFASANHPDFLTIQPDGKGIKIEQIRAMQEKVYEKPILGERKVYIIEDAETMRSEAQNCLLKTLEEPPSYAVIILLTSNESALLLTIKSRCLKIPFEKIPDEILQNYLLKNGFSKVTEEMLRLYDGSIGKALELREKQEEYDGMVTIVGQLEHASQLDYIKQTEIFSKNKEDIQELLAYLIVLLYQKMKEDLRYRKVIEIVEQAKIRLNRNANFDMTIDQMLLKMWEEMNEKHHRS